MAGQLTPRNVALSETKENKKAFLRETNGS